MPTAQTIIVKAGKRRCIGEQLGTEIVQGNLITLYKVNADSKINVIWADFSHRLLSACT